jgi:urease accessory protein
MKTALPIVNRWVLQVLALLVTSSLGHAHAHVGVGETGGFSHGFCHPLGGLDHLCAMIAVGLWAAQMDGRSIWAVPLSFVSVMVLGGVVGMLGIPVSFAEQGIVISVLILGVFITAAVRLPLAPSIIIVGLFALCHGYAHGAEMPENVSGFTYAAGFILATAALHVVGIGAGVALQKLANASVVRFAGVALVLCACWFWVG